MGATLPLFFALAFMPCLFHLTKIGLGATQLLPALGPVAAGFWLACSLREQCVSLALLGPLVSALLLAVNWVMLAGGNCCVTMH
jgi:hypothetical protein